MGRSPIVKGVSGTGNRGRSPRLAVAKLSGHGLLDLLPWWSNFDQRDQRMMSTRAPLVCRLYSVAMVKAAEFQFKGGFSSRGNANCLNACLIPIAVSSLSNVGGRASRTRPHTPLLISFGHGDGNFFRFPPKPNITFLRLL